ncbi:MAG: KUP/HAK/KT family potassium transporter, partial [Spirochaetota bacterium]
MKIDFTSYKLKSQIYIETVNWLLMLSVLLMLVVFKRSDRLACAYGLAVTGSMFITGVMMCAIFYIKKKPVHLLAAFLVTCIDLAFFASNFYKIPNGGYWSLILASVPFCIIILWIKGNRRIFRNLRPLDIDTFLPGYSQIYGKNKNIPGTALYFIGNPKSISPYIIHCMVQCNIIYEKNILMSVYRSEYPFGIEIRHNQEFGPGLESLEIIAGFKEDVDIGQVISTQGINPKIIFYGIEDISTNNFFWGIFSVIKRLSPSFVKFYKVPAAKLHGVVSRVEI